MIRNVAYGKEDIRDVHGDEDGVANVGHVDEIAPTTMGSAGIYKDIWESTYKMSHRVTKW